MKHDIELPGIGIFKVVQIYVEGLPHLPFGNTESYHRDILGDFLKNKNIPFGTKQLFGKDLPSLKGNEYEVVGMGYLLRADKSLLFSGESGNYDMKINAEHVEMCKLFFKCNELRVKIK